jgi:hypothetical protein
VINAVFALTICLIAYWAHGGVLGAFLGLFLMQHTWRWWEYD